MSDENHALRNAKAWLETIVELVAKMDAANEAEDYESADEVREEIQDGPLSVQVRSGWYSPGADRDDIDREPAEYEILLSTGGPALRIVGDLGQHCQPDSAYLEYQDWGTPWTRLYETTDDEDKAILAYASAFYFGE